jgi:hypothetical protein
LNFSSQEYFSAMKININDQVLGKKKTMKGKKGVVVGIEPQDENGVVMYNVLWQDSKSPILVDRGTFTVIRNNGSRRTTEADFPPLPTSHTSQQSNFSIALPSESVTNLKDLLHSHEQLFSILPPA